MNRGSPSAMDQSDFEVGSDRNCTTLYSSPGSLQEPQDPFPLDEVREHEDWRLWAAHRYVCLPWWEWVELKEIHVNRSHCKTQTHETAQSAHIGRSGPPKIGKKNARWSVRTRRDLYAPETANLPTLSVPLSFRRTPITDPHIFAHTRSHDPAQAIGHWSS